MRFIGYRCLLLLCVSTLLSCAIKGYNSPELADDQVATVALKSPVVSLIPIFWIFPLNMLTWLAEDWHETSRHYEIKVDDVELNRFKTMAVRPGPLRITSKKSTFVRKRQAGTARCNKSRFEYKDPTGKDAYDETTSCTTPYLITDNIQICQMLLSVEAGQHYEVFIRNTNLMLLNLNNQHIENSSCNNHDESHTWEDHSSSISYNQPY